MIRKAIKCLLYIRFFAVIKCPCCQGKGGRISGYYEPDWDDCDLCSYAWDYASKNWFKKTACELDFFGKVSPWKWFKYQVGCEGSFYVFLKCKIGRHTWVGFDEHGKICCVCYKFKESEE